MVIGPDDRARNEVQLKDLMAKTQEAVAIGALVSRVREMLAAPSPMSHVSSPKTPNG